MRPSAIGMSNVRYMNFMFRDATNFNQDISEWDTSTLENARSLFQRATSFDQNISEWDMSNVLDMAFMFNGASEFNQVISDWNVGKVTDMSFMFRDASKFNQDISNWAVDNATTLRSMFQNARAFNQNISGWNLSGVENLGSMFNGAIKFNQNLTSWDVSDTTDMSFMFRGASAFNGNISGWNTSEVTTMREMFADAPLFNQNIGSWNVSKVETMLGMFNGAESFDANIGNWDISNVTNTAYMFRDTPFNHDIGEWNVSKVGNMDNMFHRAASFNQDISGWDTSSVTFMRNMFQEATAFSQDLTSWEVVDIASEPTDFATSSGFASSTNLHPRWGWTNVAPNAAAGSDQTVNSGATGTLNGSNSNDGDDDYTDAITYKWTLTQGTLSSWTNDTGFTNSPTRSFTAPALSTGDSNTTLIFQLEVREAAVKGGASFQTSTDTVTITVQPDLPTVTAAHVSVTGATGGSGNNIFKIGDNVTASWVSGTDGDNQDDINAVSFDFIQFGGDNVSATFTSGSGTWSATYQIQAGSIDAVQNRNVIVNATDTRGNIATVADTQNVTVDNVRPTSQVTGNANTDGATPFEVTVLFGSAVTGFDSTGDITLSTMLQ